MENIIGKIFNSNNYGQFQVLEKTDKTDKWNAFIYKIRFIDTGYEKFVVKDKIIKGTIKDDTLFIGKVYTHKKYGEYKINKKVGKNKHNNSLYEIEFLNTNYRVIKSFTEINTGRVKDRFYPDVCDMGYLGNATKAGNKKIYGIWKSMLTRCYSKTHPTYQQYGAIGVSVCDRWHCFEYFLEDFPNIEGYEQELFDKGKLEIDKDIKQENCNNKVYSLETCCLISHEINMKHIKRLTKRFKAISPNGDILYIDGITSFAREYHISPNSIKKCLNGTKKNFKGWVFEKILTNEVL
jgi:hypothetical protein